MTRFLLATDSVHTTAAACDYLADRVADGDDVVVVTVVESGADPRDAGDAANVARVRLARAPVETLTPQGDDPAATVLELAGERDADELVVVARSGAQDAGVPVGSTAREIIANADRPVVVVPLADRG